MLVRVCKLTVRVRVLFYAYTAVALARCVSSWHAASRILADTYVHGCRLLDDRRAFRPSQGRPDEGACKRAKGGGWWWIGGGLVVVYWWWFVG